MINPFRSRNTIKKTSFIFLLIVVSIFFERETTLRAVHKQQEEYSIQDQVKSWLPEIKNEQDLDRILKLFASAVISWVITDFAIKKNQERFIASTPYLGASPDISSCFSLCFHCTWRTRSLYRAGLYKYIVESQCAASHISSVISSEE